MDHCQPLKEHDVRDAVGQITLIAETSDNRLTARERVSGIVLDLLGRAGWRSHADQIAGRRGAHGFQSRVCWWVLSCFGMDIARDKVERNHRFIEEALELVQATGCTRSEAHQLVDYVFDRPVGDPAQEAGGVMVTLAALCAVHGLDMGPAGEAELARVWTKVDVIRAKQAAKPKHSPLPAQPPLVMTAPPETSARVVLQGALGAGGRRLDFVGTQDFEFFSTVFSWLPPGTWDLRMTATAAPSES